MVIPVPSPFSETRQATKPSKYLSSLEWVESVKTSVRGCKAGFSANAEDFLLADELCLKVKARFNSEILPRIKDKEKHSHWSLEWAQINFSAVAAIAVLFRHVKADITSSRSDISLLKVSNLVEAIGPNRMLGGAYCYKHEESIVRVGSTSRTFLLRDVEHQKCANLLELADKASQFYTCYPSKGAAYSKAIRRGFREDLEMFVCLGYDQSDQVAVDMLCSPDEDKGVLNWKGYITKIKCVKFSGCGDDIKRKQLRMVAYLWELFYGLLTSPRDNVSLSPGFESTLGIFGGAE